MKRGLITLCSLAAMICANTTFAASYYVSKSGDDSNAGTLKAPFKTISKAASIVKAGDECFIMEGVYHEVLKPVNSGTEQSPITFKNYKKDQVIIDATEEINGWERSSGDIYMAKTEMVNPVAIYNTLFYDNEVLDIARWPNNSDGDKFTFDGYQVDGGSESHFDTSGMPDVDFTDGYFCYLGAHSGMSWSRKVNSYKDGVIKFNEVDITRWPFTPHNATIFRNGNYGQLIMFGKMELLDAPGEWLYDSDKKVIYAMFPNGDAPKDGSVKGGVRATTMEIESDYITIDGLDCFGGEIRISGSYCTLKNGEFINCAQTYDGLIDIAASSNTATILVSGHDIVIEDNLLEGGLTNGIMIVPENRVGENYLIHNNVIRKFNTLGLHARPISSTGNRTTITNNTIYTCGRDGITTWGRWCEIAYNDVSNCMKVNNDGGVFYTVGNDELKHTKIHHNYFHDSYGPVYADGRAAGIYLDNHSKGYDVYNNIVWNITWSALMFNWYNTDFNFYNNTIWDAGYNMGRWANGFTFERIKVVNNYANVTSGDKIEKKRDEADWIGDIIGTNILEEESPFVSVDNQNFAPAKGSSLIDAGEIIEGFSKKYKGSRPDVGAYELGEKPWKVGASWAKDVVGDDLIYSKEDRTPYSSLQKREGEDDIFKVMLENRDNK